MTRRTKIVATLGPASDEPVSLERMLRAGVDVVRLNLSHGPVEEHLVRLARVRTAAAAVGRPIAVLADLPGPKVRSGRFPEGGVDLAAGASVRLRPGDEPSSADLINVDYPTLLTDVQVGDRLIVGDGAISLRVTAVHDDEAEAVVDTGGRPQGRPGVHLPSERLRLSTPTDEDLVLAERMADAGVEFVAVSFVRSADDVRKVKAVVAGRAEVMSKIETSTALANLTEIIEVSDAIMVARGDLGIDCPLEDLPHCRSRSSGAAWNSGSL